MLRKDAVPIPVLQKDAVPIPLPWKDAEPILVLWKDAVLIPVPQKDAEPIPVPWKDAELTACLLGVISSSALLPRQPRARSPCPRHARAGRGLLRGGFQ